MTPPTQTSAADHHLHHPSRTTAGAGELLAISPQEAGWARCGLRVVRLGGEPLVLATGDAECFVVPLSGAVEVVVSAERSPGAVEARFALEGRSSVFARVTDFAYVGRDSVIELRGSAGVEVAVPSARCGSRREPRYGAAQDVPVLVLGAGGATRQLTDFGAPGAWDHAESLICREVLTPGGNWSSFPPHKHDVTDPCPVVNEEIYYYRLAGADGLTPDERAFGLHVTATGPEHEAAGLVGLDERLVVRDGDAVLVPYGYHGPCVAAPGYDMYYLNVMAGPGLGRSLQFCDHPDHAWVRDSWAGQAADPRCPLTDATGRRRPGSMSAAEDA
jgi:5-deoxy-glucuronate isomerase